MTPPMAAGIADRIWTVRDLLEAARVNGLFGSDGPIAARSNPGRFFLRSCIEPENPNTKTVGKSGHRVQPVHRCSIDHSVYAYKQRSRVSGQAEISHTFDRTNVPCNYWQA